MVPQIERQQELDGHPRHEQQDGHEQPRPGDTDIDGDLMNHERGREQRPQTATP